MSNTNVLVQKSDFTITVNKKGGKILANDPITVKNQIREIRTIDDLPGVNKTQRVDGATLVYNANTFEYDVKLLDNLPNLTVGNLYISTIWAGNTTGPSSGANDQVLASNGTHTYWKDTITTVYSGNGLSGGGQGAANVVLYVNAAYMEEFVTVNNAIHAFGKTEDRLSVESAVFAVNANFAYTSNNSTYLNGKTEDTLEVQTAVLAVNANFSYVSNFAYTANVANYAFGKGEGDLNVNSASWADNAGQLQGQQAVYFTNASNMSSGTLPNERLPVLDGGFF